MDKQVKAQDKADEPFWTWYRKLIWFVIFPIVALVGFLFLIPTCSSTPTQILIPDLDSPNFGIPVWSPDGTKIAFPARGGTADTTEHDIYIMNPDGTNLTNITNSDRRHDSDPSWSSDGTKIVFMSSGHIGVINADGTNKTYLTSTTRKFPDHLEYDEVMSEQSWTLHAGIRNLSKPSFSPDSSKIVFGCYLVNDPNPSGSHICTMNAEKIHEITFNTEVMRDLANLNIISIVRTNGPPNPSWSPDGSKILFETFRDEYYSHELHVKENMPTGTMNQIYIMNPDGSNQTNISTPGGAKLVRRSDPEVFIEIEDSVGNASGDHNPSWSPDGTKIVFTSHRSYLDEWRNYKIFIMNADGTNQTGLAKLPNHIGIHKENFEDIKDKDKTIDILCPCSLSPDNTKLVFKAVERYNSRYSSLYILDVNISE